MQARAASGRYFVGQCRKFTTTSITPVADKLYAVPFDLSISIDALLIVNNGSGSEDAVVRAGLYDSDPDTGLPTDLIEDLGEFGISNSENGLIVMDLSEPYYATTPWVVMIFGGETMPSVSSTQTSVDEAHRVFGSSALNDTPGPVPAQGLTANMTYGALPSTFPTPTLTVVNVGFGVRPG